jgi:hypothetical protein
MVEWLLDLLVLPFVLCYILAVPWRLNELWGIAVEQYENVPAARKRVKGLSHVSRDLSNRKMPKRVQVAYDLLRFLIKDYLTILITVVLLCTGWRAINTLEILYTYSNRHSLLRCCKRATAQEKLLTDHSIKDVSL